MTSEVFDFVIPLFQIRWNTRAVLEGITSHYQPRAIHVIAPQLQAEELATLAKDWQTATLYTHPEEDFFQTVGLSKDAICAEIDLGQSLYTPGWFYQQLLKLGAFEGIPDLSEWYVVWDSDLLPAATWQLLQETEEDVKHTFALLQDNRYGNPKIVNQWDKWISSILGVEAITNDEGTFIPHHIWFKQEHLKTMTKEINRYYESTDHWLLLMMRSANDFGTFSEYWSYVSWVADKAPEDLSFYPYPEYGATTERFFDDGTGIFSARLRESMNFNSDQVFFPSYTEVDGFIRQEYKPNELPSSLSFESSPRHLKKNPENMHIEELRSRWNPRMVKETVSVAS